MSVLAMARLRWLRVVCVALLAAACGPSERFFHDARYLPGGRAIELAALMPDCGCVTLRNTTGSEIELVSWLQGTEIGSMVLAKDEAVRIKYDWAGPDNADRYEITAYGRKFNQRTYRLADGSAEENVPARTMADAVAKDYTVETTCGDRLCTFGSLNLDRAYSARVGQNQVDARRVGVAMRNAGQLAEAAASPGRCGCAVLKNFSTSDLVLQSMLNGALTGELPLPKGEDAIVAFDSAGQRDEDVYVLAAIPTNNAEAQPPSDASVVTSANAVTPRGAIRTLRLQDYIRVVAQMDGLSCTPAGAPVHLPLALLTLDGKPMTGDAASTASQAILNCPFGSLAMNQLAARLGAQNDAAAPGKPATNTAQRAARQPR